MLGLLVLGPILSLAIKIILAPFRLVIWLTFRLVGIIASPFRILP